MAVGTADDHDAADNRTVLDFWQAQDRAKTIAKRKLTGQTAEVPTVRAAAEAYLHLLKARNARSAGDAEGRLKKHFLPQFGDLLVSSLTKTRLDAWLASMVVASDEPERVRRSKDSANRVLTMVKALLNHAARDARNGVTDEAWRLVKPFREVAQARAVRYTAAEVKKLLDSASDQATANLISAAYLTGARYGELAAARVGDFDQTRKTLRIGAGKTGGRTVVLQTSASAFLARLVAHRVADEFLFVRADGTRWKRSDQTRPVKDAIEKAGLSPDGSLYALRHTYISEAIEGGVPLNIIAENCGTSVRMIEKTYAKILDEKRRDFIEQGAPSLYAA